MKLITRFLVYLIVLNIILVILNVFIPNWSIEQIDALIEQSNPSDRLVPNESVKGMDGIVIQGKPEFKLERALNEKN